MIYFKFVTNKVLEGNFWGSKHHF